MEAVLTFAGAAADQLPVHRVVHVCASVLRPRDHGRVDRGLLQGHRYAHPPPTCIMQYDRIHLVV